MVASRRRRAPGRARPPRRPGRTGFDCAISATEGVGPSASKYGLPIPSTSLDQMIVVLSQIERDGRRAGGDHLVDIRPRLVRASPCERRRLVHRGVDLRVVELGEVVVPAVRSMFLPLNVGSSIDCGSVKSLNQPASADRTCFFGHLAELGVDRVLRDRAELDLEAELLELRLRDLGLGLARVRVGRDQQELALPVYLPTGSRPSSCTSSRRSCRRAGSSGSRSRGPPCRRPPRSPGCRAAGSASGCRP